jgi:hypothetical protein
MGLKETANECVAAYRRVCMSIWHGLCVVIEGNFR